MAVRLYSEFKSDNGKQYKIEIHDANWLAASTEFNVDSRGFELIYEGETDDIVSPIVSSRLQFGAYSTNATFETFVDTLKTFQENRFQIAVYKYNGTSYDLYWAGWILQDLVSVEDASQPYIYELTATDGLGRLANVEYTSANTIIEANGLQLTRVTDVVKTALNNIGTSNLWGSSDVFFETAADWWETNAQTYSTSVDPIANQAFDVRYFREFDDDGNVVYSSTLEILRQIATLYNGRFYMQNGRFVFEQYGNRDTASRYVSRYTKTGTAISRTSVSDDVTINQTDDAARTSGNNWNFLPAAQKAKIHYVQKFLNPFNAFGLYRFRLATNAFTAGFIAGGSGVQLALGSTQFNFRVVGAASLTSPIFPVFKMRIRIQDSSTGTYYYYNRAYNGVVAGGAMFGTAAWSTTAGEYFFDLPPFFTSGVAIVKNPVQIVTADIPVNGEIDFRLQLHGVFRSKNGTTYTPSQPAAFDAIFVFGIQTNGASNAPGATFSSTNSEAGIDSKLTIDLGDLVIADGPIQTGHLSVYNGSAWTGSSDWRKGSSGTGLPILKLLTNETLALHVRPIEQYNGTFSLSAFFGQRLLFNSAAYLMTSGTFTANDDQWSSTLYKIETIRASVTPVDPVDDLVDRTSLIATTTTDGSSPNDIIGGRIGGMVVDIEDQKVGPFQQTGTGARITGTMNVTGDVTLDAGLDVDGVSQFNNDVNITGSVTSTGPLTGEYVQLDTTYNTTPVQGQIVWSQDDGTIDVGLNSNVTMQVGQEQFWYVKNQTGSTIAKGTAVRAAGTLGASGRILAAPMIADGSVPARFLLGIAAENIVDGGEGYVTTFGKIRQLNTSAYTEGAVLWCNPAVAGGLTSTEPSAPNLKLAVAFVVRSNATSGVLAVRSEIGARVSDASDVQVTSVADNDLLQYNTTTSRWENVAGTTTNIGEGTNLYYTDARSRAAISETIDGISYNNTTGVFSLDANRVIVTTTQTGEWDTAYNDRIVSAAVAGTTTKTLTLTQGDGGTITASWTDYDTAPVTSVNGQTGVVVLTTDNINEGTSNLYYTDGRARASLSAGTGITYNNTTGVITNAAPDQVVALTASTAIAVTGTYPNFTIENTAPDQVVALTASTGISVTGTYPNFTITNTAPSSGGTITGGGTTNYLSKWTGASALGDSLVYDNGTNVGIGTSTPNSKLDVRGVIEGGDGTIRTVVSYTGSGGVTGTITNHPYILYANNDERMRITAAGNVGIGTTSPTAKLDVIGTARILAADAPTSSELTAKILAYSPAPYGMVFRAYSSGTNSIQVQRESNDSEMFALTLQPNGGNVGIGTTSPTAKLDVYNTSNAEMRISTASEGYLLLGQYTNGGFIGTSSSDATAGVLRFGTAGTERMRITAGGNVGVGTTDPSGGGVVGSKFTISVGDNETAFAILSGSSRRLAINTLANGGFVFYDGGSGVWNAGIVQVNGNVGVGTTSPAYRLDINGNARANGLTLNGFATGTAGGNLELGFDGTQGVVQAFNRTTGWIPLYLSGIDIRFNPDGTERMRITNAGNVGIGITNPQYKLHIQGSGLMASIQNLSAGTDEYSQLEFAAGNRRGYIWLGNENTSAWAGAGGLNLYTSNGNMDFWTSGSQKVRIDTSGNVGIGTTAPNTKLRIVESTTTPPLSIQNTNADGYSGSWLYDSAGTLVGHWGWANGSTTALSNKMYFGTIANKDVVFTTNDTEKVRITAGGNVGIGTTAPQSIFEVAQSTPTISITSTIAIESTTNNQTLSQFIFYKHYGLAQGAKIAMLQSGGMYNYPQAHLAFFTNDGSGGWSAPSERMRIKDNGNVGIGTTDPGTKLDVAGVTRSGAFLTNDATTTSIPIDTGGSKAYFDASNINGPAITLRADSVGRTIRMYDGNSSVAAIDANSGGLYIGTNSSHAIRFAPNASEAMRIAVGGNVGIGTTAPVGKLSILVDGASTWSHYIQTPVTANKRNSIGFHDNTGVNIAAILTDINNDGTADFGISVPNGLPRLVIKSSGNVGIGTTSPSFPLSVAGKIGGTLFSDSHLEFLGSGNTILKANNDVVIGYSQSFYVTQGGNVGIGTTSPSAKLNVFGSSGSGSFSPQEDLLHVGGNELGGVGGYAGIRLAGTSVSSYGVYIRGVKTTAYGNYWNDALTFSVTRTNTETTIDEVMRITSDGNVGIGTTSPVTKLQVASATNAVDVLRIGNTAGDSGSVQGVTHLAINHFNAGTNPSTRITAYQDGTSGWPGGMYFSTRSLNTDSAPVERMRITSAGNVGIGTTAPSNILHITNVMRMDNVVGSAPQITSYTPRNGYGDVESERCLAEPAVWLKINVGGTEYVIPAYTQA